MSAVRIVVFASGRGSNLDAIVQAIRKKELPAQILAVVSDQPDAGALVKARQYDIPAISVPWSSLDQSLSVSDRRSFHEKQILEKILPLQPQFLVLAGYMRVLTGDFIDVFRSERGYSRMINIHPSLLPAFPGRNAYAQAYRYGAKVAGVTVHLVEKEVDSGPVCAQESFSIADCRTEIEVEEKGLAVEHRLFPDTLKWVLREDFSIEHRLDGRICVRSY